MDLIYTDVRRNDVGVLKDYTFDLAYGIDENDFELTIDLNNHCCEPDCLIYIEGTEYGGIIDGLAVTTTDEKLAYTGRTWHGILASKVIEPNEGEDYFTVSGDANDIIGELIKRVGLDNLFVTSAEASGLVVENYKFDSYVDMYTGITKMLHAIDGKLNFSFSVNSVIVSAAPCVDYSKDEQFDSDVVEMQIEKRKNTVNHLICIGKKEEDSEESDLPVVHLYKNEDGRFNTETKVFTGLHEIVGIHEYSNSDDLQKLIDELANGDTSSLKDNFTEDKVQLDLTDEDKTYDVGDIISAREDITGIVAREKITKKIVTISQGEVNIQYKVGE